MLPSLGTILPGLIQVYNVQVFPRVFTGTPTKTALRSAATVKAEAAQLRLEMDELAQRRLDSVLVRFSWRCLGEVVFVTMNFSAFLGIV